MRTLAVLRIAALLWAIVGVAFSRGHLANEPLAWILIALMTLTTGLLTEWPGRGRSVLAPLATSSVVFEVGIGLLVLLGDGLVYEGTRPQSLPWSWPAAGVIAAGIVFGTRAGFITALMTGAASFCSEALLLGRDNEVIAAFSKLALWILTGTIAGYVVTRLRRAEEEISIARAREEFARELHDGVLQTLAVIQRRSDDSELAALARDQEHDLRGFIAGSNDAQLGFEPALHQLASRHERLYVDCKVNVVVATDLPSLTDVSVAALSGAIGEALTNAGKHGDATKITIYAEPVDGDDAGAPANAEHGQVFVSVKDNGAGFDPATAPESIGVARSIKGRLHDAGGIADVNSAPGRGTEVRLWL